MANSNAKWVIFDAMGVIFIVGDDVADLLVPFIKKRNPSVPADQITDFYLTTSRGEMSSKQFWTAVGLGDSYPAVEQEYLETGLTVDPTFKETAIMLKCAYKLAVLSNDVHEWADHLYRKHELDFLFDAKIISGAVGYRKPQKEIYECLLQRIGARANDCMFIDDNIRNLNAAIELGFRAVLFTRNLKTCDHSFEPQVNSFPELAETVLSLFSQGK